MQIKLNSGIKSSHSRPTLCQISRSCPRLFLNLRQYVETEVGDVRLSHLNKDYLLTLTYLLTYLLKDVFPKTVDMSRFAVNFTQQ